jgi:hypothetical protein
MGKARDAAKERYWRGLIRRQAESGLRTRGFCEREGVPEYQFHWWRRTLRKRDQHEARQVSAPGTNGSQPGRARQAVASPFLSVHLPLSAVIELVHPRGHVVRIPAIFDAAALGRILAALDAAGDPPREE